MSKIPKEIVDKSNSEMRLMKRLRNGVRKTLKWMV